jgi:hypothetical protein
MLTGIYRQLKMLSAKIRYENEALEEFIGEQSARVMVFLEAMFPDRQGSFYSREGKTRKPEFRSVVLNRQF